MIARYISYIKSNSYRVKSYSAIMGIGMPIRNRLTCKKLRTASQAILYGKLLAQRYIRFCRSIEGQLNEKPTASPKPQEIIKGI